METLALPLAAAAMNSASRSVPGPRSPPLVTFTTVLPAASPTAGLCFSYHRPTATTPLSSTSTPRPTADRRLTRMNVPSTRTLQNENGMPGTLDGKPAEERVDGQRQRRRHGERAHRDRARQLRQMRQQESPEGRRIDAGHAEELQPAVRKELQVHIALTGFEYGRIAPIGGGGRGSLEQYDPSARRDVAGDALHGRTQSLRIENVLQHGHPQHQIELPLEIK